MMKPQQRNHRELKEVLYDRKTTIRPKRRFVPNSKKRQFVPRDNSSQIPKSENSSQALKAAIHPQFNCQFIHL